MKLLKEWAIQLGIAAALASAFSFFNVFATQDYGWPTVWIYWFAIFLTPMLFIAPMVRQVDTVWLERAPWAVRWAAASILAAIPMTAIVSVAQTLVGRPFGSDGLPMAFLYVLSVTLVVVALHLMIERLRAQSLPPAAQVRAQIAAPVETPTPGWPHAPQAAPTAATTPAAASAIISGPALLRRLPAKIAGGEIWALEAEDHYVRVHTSKGSDLILLRLQDAINEMGATDGARVHRSWWVARAGIAGAKRLTEGGVLTLKSGVEAPVSRANAGELKARGWW